MRVTVLLVASLLAVSCDSDKGDSAPAKAATKAPADKKADAKADKKADKKADEKADAKKPFATPTAKPPPPPEGTALLDNSNGDWLYVQKCDKKTPCPLLFQPQAETHCRELKLGFRDSWRLPDKAEAERFKELKDAVNEVEGFHWTRTPYKEDDSQAWIVDSVGGFKTTIPRTRKPFRVRCVQEP